MLCGSISPQIIGAGAAETVSKTNYLMKFCREELYLNQLITKLLIKAFINKEFFSQFLI